MYYWVHQNIIIFSPSSSSVDVLGKLLDAGMNVCRLNFSHGDHKYHSQTLKNLKEALKARPYLSCATMLDTKVPN
jgi:pyruvate kinase